MKYDIIITLADSNDIEERGRDEGLSSEQIKIATDEMEDAVIKCIDKITKHKHTWTQAYGKITHEKGVGFSEIGTITSLVDALGYVEDLSQGDDSSASILIHDFTEKCYKELSEDCPSGNGSIALPYSVSIEIEDISKEDFKTLNSHFYKEAIEEDKLEIKEFVCCDWETYIEATGGNEVYCRSKPYKDVKTLLSDLYGNNEIPVDFEGNSLEEFISKYENESRLEYNLYYINIYKARFLVESTKLIVVYHRIISTHNEFPWSRTL